MSKKAPRVATSGTAQEWQALFPESLYRLVADLRTNVARSRLRKYPEWPAIEHYACEAFALSELSGKNVNRLLNGLQVEHNMTADEVLMMPRTDVVKLLRDKSMSKRQAADYKEKPKAPRKRRTKPPTDRPMTPKQVEAVQVVSECKGNISEAAKRLGRDRKTVEEANKVGLAKLGRNATKHITKRLASDRRGQTDVATDDDRRL